MVLSNRKLKQRIRLELAKRAHQPQTAIATKLPAPSLPLVRLGPSKREKRRQRKQLIASAPPHSISEEEKPAHKPQVDEAQGEELPDGNGGPVSPGFDSREANCAADGTEMERYRQCMRKVVDKYSNDQNPAGTEEEREDGSTIVFDARGSTDSNKRKPKKNKRKLDSEDAERELKVSESSKLSKKKKKKKQKIFDADPNQDPQDPTHISNGKGRDAEGTEKKSEMDWIPTKEPGGKSFSMKSPKKNDQKQEADKLQENLAQVQSSETAEDQGLIDMKKVYVGGIPYYCSEDDIRAFFGECGSIFEIDFKTFPDSGKFRGIALISFKTEAAAQRALALDGADMGGRFLKVQSCVSNRQATLKKTVYNEPPRKTEGYTTAYIGNLSWGITEEELRGFFKDCKIDAIRFALDKLTGSFKGYGHIDFADDQSLEAALQFDQQALLGRPMKIAYAVSRRDGSKQEKNSIPLKKGKKGKVCHSCGEEGHISSHCSNTMGGN